jgi:hypothetical protein
MVGTEPRGPAVATMPTAPKDTSSPDRARDDALRHREAEGQAERAVADPEHADVAGEPGLEELARAAAALGLGDRVDPVGLDPARDVRDDELGVDRAHAITPLTSRKQA